MTYKQCVLKKDTIQTTSWIPEQFAEFGRRIKLKDGDDWNCGWMVVKAGSCLKEGSLIENQAHNCGSIWKPSASLTMRGNK